MTLKAPTKTPLTTEYVIQIWDKLFSEDFFVETMMDYEDQKTELVVLDLSKMNNSEKFDCEEAIRSLTDAPRYAVSAISEILKREYPTIQEVSVVVKDFKWCTDIKHKIREMRSGNINQAVIFDGVIRNSTPVLSKLKAMAYECGACRGVFLVEQDGDTEGDEPEMCPLCSRVDEVFTHDEMNDVFINYVECEIEEEPEGLGGKQPERVHCQFSGALTEERVRSVAGNRVTFFGVHRVKKKEKKSLIYEKYIEILGADKKGRQYEEMEISEENKREFEEMSKSPTLMEDMAKSIAPNIFGYDMEKQAILLQLFGGNLYSERRGDIHILLVGDASVGKSSLIKNISLIAPLVVKASGAPSTSVGLSGCVRRDEEAAGGYIVEAGACVLASGGLICIDENTLVITDTGVKEIKNVKIGDKIINENGAFKDTVLKNIDNGEKACIKLKLYTGDEIICTPDHKILSSNGWVNAGVMKTGDFVKIHHEDNHIVTNQDDFEMGMIHGFAICDMYINEQSNRNSIRFSAAEHNGERSEHIINLVEKHYGATFRMAVRNGAKEVTWGNKSCKFSATNQFTTSSERLKHDIDDLFKGVVGGSVDYRIGFISGILSTDTCVSHKKGINGIKHTIQIGIGRKKYNDVLLRNQKNITSILHSFGIMAVIRKRTIVISSLRSYNRTVGIFGDKIIGRNSIKMYNVVPRTKIMSDDDILDGKMQEWFDTVRFNTSVTTKEGLHSRIWNAKHKGRLTETLMNTLKPHWKDITSEEFPTFKKDYILNPVITIENAGVRKVRDLTIDGSPSFMVAGGIVHNCVDEFDKMDKDVRGTMHEIMEDQVVTISKANINTQLIAKCSVLAIMNPKNSRFVKDEKTSEQIDLPVTLLSRFDLVFALKDIVDEDKDKKITEAIDRARDGEEITYIYAPELISKYIQYARSKIKEMTKSKEAKKILSKKYIKIRQSNKGSEAMAITSRQYEGVSRLAEAHAKLRLSDTIEGEDAKAALKIMEYYLHTMCLDPGTGELCIDTVMGGKCTSEKTRDASLLEVLVEIRNNIMKENPELTGAECIFDIDYAQSYFMERGHTEKEFKKGLDSLIADMKITLQKGQSKIRIERDK